MRRVRGREEGRKRKEERREGGKRRDERRREERGGEGEGKLIALMNEKQER